MPQKTRVTKNVYRCKKCKTKYDKKKKYAACQEMPIEEKAFQKGDTVKSIRNWACSCCKGWYPAVGKVVKVLGPEPWDEDEEARRCLDTSKRFRVHTYYYHVKAPCPKCGHMRHPGGVGPEFTLVERKNKKSK